MPFPLHKPHGKGHKACFPVYQRLCLQDVRTPGPHPDAPGPVLTIPAPVTGGPPHIDKYAQLLKQNQRNPLYIPLPDYGPSPRYSHTAADSFWRVPYTDFSGYKFPAYHPAESSACVPPVQNPFPICTPISAAAPQRFRRGRPALHVSNPFFKSSFPQRFHSSQSALQPAGTDSFYQVFVKEQENQKYRKQ